MPLPTIIANNQTASPIVLDSLGQTVPASSTLTLTTSAFLTEANESPELVAEVDAGNILLTVNGVALDATQSANFLNPGVTTLGTRKDYGALAVDPVAPAPNSGDTYYNTNMEMPMSYDGTRAKWLSVTDFSLAYGENNTTNLGQFFRGPGNTTPGTGAGNGIQAVMWNATFVGVTFQRTNAPNAVTIEVLDQASTVIYTITATTLNTFIDNAINLDIPQGGGVKARVAAASPNTPQNDNSIVFRYKWRAT